MSRRLRTPRFGDEPRHERTRTLLRGAGRFTAVVVVTGAVGALVGVGLAALTGDDASPAPAPAQAARATATGAATPTAAAGPGTTPAPAPATADPKLRVDVLSTVAHPVTAPGGETGLQARVSVHVRVTNGTDHVVRSAPPVLLVGDAEAQIAAGSSGAAGTLPAVLEPGAVADGRLRFDTAGAITSRLTTAAVRLRIVGKTARLAPEIGRAAA